MTSRTTWPIEPHTQAKHNLLRFYLDAWFPILSSRNNPHVIFLDGFAGPGIYAEGEPGSPIVALNTLMSHSHFSSMSQTKFTFILIERDSNCFKSLKGQLRDYWSDFGGKPNNVFIHPINNEFRNVAEQMVTATQGRLAPTLAFIDPFGWSGVPMATIRDLLSARKCEVIFNFMYDSVNRFVADETPSVAHHFAELFGTEGMEHHLASDLATEDRKTFLRDLYVDQLRSVGGFRFVTPFEVINQNRGRTAYFLVFGTRSPMGFDRMKGAMWRVDPVSGCQYSGDEGDQLSLFPPQPNLGPLKTAILDRFAGTTVGVNRLEQFVVEETRYTSTQYKRVLKDLETEGSISCVSGRKKAGTYPPGTILRFEPLKDHRHPAPPNHSNDGYSSSSSFSSE